MVFVVDNPSLWQSAEVCQPEPLLIKKFFRKWLNKQASFCQNLSASDWRNQDEYLSFVGKLQKLHPDLLFFDAKSSLCEKNGCLVFKDSYLLYNDFNHLSVYGSTIVANGLVKKILQIR